MRCIVKKFKKGVASFYIVAFSTLILVIVVASFAAVVISEIARTSNDDLSQSAYDAALAGVEDAKLAYTNYQACVKKGINNKDKDPATFSDLTECEKITWYMNNPDCDMVAHMLGREISDGKVIISETKSGNNNMNQAYTCVMINPKVPSYKASLSSSGSYKVVRVNGLSGVSAGDIKSIILNWYSNREGKNYNYKNRKGSDGKGDIVFPSLKTKEAEAATPPTVALELVQTAENFTMGQLNGQTVDSGENAKTDRATLYLVPKNVSSDTIITAETVANTNNLKRNDPIDVNCNSDKGFACSAVINLPDPIGGQRSDQTFMLVVSLPYGTPDTDFEIKFCTEVDCRSDSSDDVGTGETVDLEKMQVSIDSTGRANDLYRRVEVRMETGDAGFSYPLYAIEAVKDSGGNGGTIEKQLSPTSEYGV